MKLKFNNYTFVHGGRDHLASGEAAYHIEEDFDEQEAVIDDVFLVEVMSPNGWVKAAEFHYYKDSVIEAFNRDENFIRSLTP